MRTGCTGCDTQIPHLHMSDLGSCVKAQVAGLMGYKPVAPPEKMEAIYARGVAHEEECAEAMRAEGWVISGEQFELTLPGALPVYGHLDAYIWAADLDPNEFSPRIWEAKAPGAWARFEQAVRLDSWTDPLMHRYAYQISCYMHATGLEALVCCVEDGRVKTFGVEVPPISLADIQIRVAAIEALVSAKHLPSTCTQVDYPCSYVYLHTDTRPDRTVITDEEVIDAASQYQAITAHESQLKLRKKTLRAIMDEACDTVGDYTAGDVDITVYARKNPAKLDEDAMKRDGIDVESYRKSDGETVAMKVTPRRGA